MIVTSFAAERKPWIVISRPKPRGIPAPHRELLLAVETATNLVSAYYTIAAGSIPFIDLPQEKAKRLPERLGF